MAVTSKQAAAEVTVARWFAAHTGYQDLIDSIAGHIARAETDDERDLWVARLRRSMRLYFRVDVEDLGLVADDPDAVIAEAEANLAAARVVVDVHAKGSPGWRAALAGVEFWTLRVAVLRSVARAGSAR